MVVRPIGIIDVEAAITAAANHFLARGIVKLERSMTRKLWDTRRGNVRKKYWGEQYTHQVQWLFRPCPHRACAGSTVASGLLQMTLQLDCTSTYGYLWRHTHVPDTEQGHVFIHTCTTTIFDV